MGALSQLTKTPGNSPGAFFASNERLSAQPAAAEFRFDADQFLSAASETIVTKYRTGECIFAQGDPADCVFYVRQGTIKLTVVSEKGKEATIGMLDHGDLCGEGCLADEPRRLLTATLMSTGVILRIQKKPVLKLLRDHPDFSAFFTRFLVGRAIRIQQDLIDQRFHPSEVRLARLLMSLSKRGPQQEDRPVLPRISQEILASMVGTTRSRISFFLNKFKRAGLIEYSGGIRVNSGLADMFQGR